MITNDEPGSEPESHTHHQADNIQSLRFDNFFYVWSSTIVKCCVYLCKSVDCDCGWVLLLCCASLQLFPPRMFAEHNWMHITCADLFYIHLSPAQPAQPRCGKYLLALLHLCPGSARWRLSARCRQLTVCKSGKWDELQFCTAYTRYTWQQCTVFCGEIEI